MLVWYYRTVVDPARSVDLRPYTAVCAYVSPYPATKFRNSHQARAFGRLRRARPRAARGAVMHLSEPVAHERLPPGSGTAVPGYWHRGDA
eukprot:SAG31_NODE_2786_length_5092_cov_3.254556_5_plen_90_part_00